LNLRADFGLLKLNLESRLSVQNLETLPLVRLIVHLATQPKVEQLVSLAACR
jgi:hypothetical protein